MYCKLMQYNLLYQGSPLVTPMPSELPLSSEPPLLLLLVLVLVLLLLCSLCTLCLLCLLMLLYVICYMLGIIYYVLHYYMLQYTIT